MVEYVYGARKELGRLRICTSDDHHAVVHHVKLEPGSNEPRGMGGGWDEDLAGKMSTFLATN